MSNSGWRATVGSYKYTRVFFLYCLTFSNWRAETSVVNLRLLAHGPCGVSLKKDSKSLVFDLVFLKLYFVKIILVFMVKV